MILLELNKFEKYQGTNFKKITKASMRTLNEYRHFNKVLNEMMHKILMDLLLIKLNPEIKSYMRDWTNNSAIHEICYVYTF